MTTTSSKIHQDQTVVTAVEPVTNKDGVVIASTVTTTTTPAVQEYQGKLGDKCCGCCCDFRRAVIICNIILLVLAVLTFLAIIAGATVDTAYSTDDDSAYDTYFTIEIITLVITIVMNIVSISGAILYNVWMVLIPAIWYLIEYVVSIANAFAYCSAWEDQMEEESDYLSAECSVPPGYIIGGLGITLCWIYPHIGFIKEVKAGTMSEETYPREEYSCCCTA